MKHFKDNAYAFLPLSNATDMSNIKLFANYYNYVIKENNKEFVTYHVLFLTYQYED